jgi:site-specific DNA recombinase
MAMLGTSTNKIALSLNQEGIPTKAGSLWYPLTVRRILNNLTYTGKTYFGQTKRVDGRIEAQPKENWTLLPDVSPPIITIEIFEKAQEAIKNARDSRPVKPNAAYLLTGFIRCPKCGSRISGMTMNGKYRYYQCQGSRPTATRGKICDAGYIKADELKTEAWRKVIVMMTSPQTVLKTLTDNNLQQPDNIISLLNKQIDQLRKKLKTYSTKEKKLYDSSSHKAVTGDYVLESDEKLRQERINDEQQLKLLLEQRKEVSRSQNLSLQLSDYSMNQMASMFLEHEYRTFDIINSEDDAPYLVPVSISERLANRRLLLESIKLRVIADPKSFSFNFTLQGNLISSAQEEEFASFDKELRKFEEENTDVTLGDLIDANKELPEGTPFAHKVNEFKNDLVTIEQTSG